MKRRAVAIVVSDHAVLRWLEREHDLDIEAIRALIAGQVLDAAELAARAVQIGKVRFVLDEHRDQSAAGGTARVVVATALPVKKRRGNRLNFQRGDRDG